MDAKELEKLLKSHTVPEPRQEIIQEHLNKARLAFTYAAQPTQENPRRARSLWFLQGAVFGTAACALLAFVVLQNEILTRPLGLDPASSSTQLSLFESLTSSAQNSTPALKDALQVIFTAHSHNGSSTAAVIELTKEGKSYKLVTFCGDTLYLKVDDSLLELHPTLQSDGSLALITNKGSIVGNSTLNVEGVSIKAYVLPPA